MIHFILGQTATGKTARAVRLAREIDGELINCDSRQIYKELDIITGKTDNPTDIPMHMVDLVDVSARYSAHEYAMRAKEIIGDIIARGRSPIIVGGTGLYAHYLLHMKESLATSYEPEMKLPINTDEEGSVKDVQMKIGSINPTALANLNHSDRANPHRLLSLLAKLQNPSYVSPLDTRVTLLPDVPQRIQILLHESPGATRDRLSLRVASRLAAGAVEECRHLLARGYTPEMPGLQTLGYAQLFAYLSGALSLEDATQQWSAAEYQYAKRQKTYFKKYFPTAEIVQV